MLNGECLTNLCHFALHMMLECCFYTDSDGYATGYPSRRFKSAPVAVSIRKCDFMRLRDALQDVRCA